MTKVDLRPGAEPKTDQQLEELLEQVFHLEHAQRHAFRALDSVTPQHDPVHRCALPQSSPVSHQTFDCPVCGQRFSSRWLSTHWLPE